MRKSRPKINEVMDVIIMVMQDSIIRVKKHKIRTPNCERIPEMQNKMLSIVSSLESDYFSKDKEFFMKNPADITSDIFLLHPDKISAEELHILSQKYKPVNPTMYRLIKTHADKYLHTEMIPEYQSTEHRTNILDEFVSSLKPLYFEHITKKSCSLPEFKHLANSHKNNYLCKIID